MTRTVRCVFAQHAPREAATGLKQFETELSSVLARHPDAQLVAFPEIHLFGGAEDAEDQASWFHRFAEPVPGPRTRTLGEMARRHRVWLIPGSVPESTPEGHLYNTALVFSPDGELVDTYRKVFPWRPSEPWTSGSAFSAFDVPDLGRWGVNICYDSWYPEATRQIAWLGAEAVLNLVKTTTPDREQELVLARANAITNQVFYLSLNAAGPEGVGRSIFVDPQGHVLHESPGAEEEEIALTIELDDVTRTRRDGTAGFNRMWAQFRPTDAPIDLPAYAGVIDPRAWSDHEQKGAHHDDH